MKAARQRVIADGTRISRGYIHSHEGRRDATVRGTFLLRREPRDWNGNPWPFIAFDASNYTVLMPFASVDGCQFYETRGSSRISGAANRRYAYYVIVSGE